MIKRLYNWYGKRTVNIILIMVILLVVSAVILSKRGNGAEETLDSKRMVNVASVVSLSNASTIELVGSVEAVDHATIQSEVSGSVTSVNVSLGDTVRAGQVLGQVENASERAAVLQAEGSYEAALASAAQSDSSAKTARTSLINAQNSGINTYRAAFTTTDNVIRNSIDELYSNPAGDVLGFKLNAVGNANTLNNTRKSIEPILKRWSSEVTTSNNPDDVLILLRQAESDLTYIGNFVELVATVASHEDNDDANINGTSIVSIRANMNAAREDMNAARQSVENAIRSVENAEDALVRAEIAGQSGEVSAASAQVKQALGSLQAAEASLEKTIFRTPISGTINTLAIKKGDFVNSFQAVASVANNDAFEITTYVGEVDRDRLQIGDTVRVDSQYDGFITNIAPALDPATKKIEVKIQTETTALASGDSVKIEITSDDTEVVTDTRIFVPLTAVKFSSVDGSILTVNNGVIESHPVALGTVSGSNVEILQGLNLDDVIIVDARGLNAGQQVDINQI